MDFLPFKVLFQYLDLKMCNIMVICSFAPYGYAHGPKTCQIWHQGGPDLVEWISPKLLDRFTPFKVLWNCKDLWLYNVMVIYRFLPHMGLPMGQYLVKSGTTGGSDFAEHMSLKLLDGWIYTIETSMELSKFKLLWNCLNGLMTLTLDFRGQMLQKAISQE